MVGIVGARDQMKENHMEPEARRSNRWLRRAGVAAATAISISMLSVATAGASTGCGEYSYGFTGTRLLNDGISNSAGPFPIDLPAGTYTVTLVSSDHHDEQVAVPTQPGEQYVVVLDSGYVSPPSRDIADDETVVTTTHVNQTVPASTSISVQHLGVPGINSVDVLCVGFTPEPDEPSTPDAASEEADSSTDVAVPDESVSANDESQEEGSDQDPAGEQALVPPVSITVEPEESVADTPEPEVQGVVEIQASSDVQIAGPVAEPAQLAITGPSLSATLTLLGVSMIALGVALVRRESALS